MNTLFEPLLELQQYQHMLENIRNHNTPILASGMIDVQQTHMIAGICHHLQRPAVILTYSELRARQIYANFLAKIASLFFVKIPFFIQQKIYFFIVLMCIVKRLLVSAFLYSIVISLVNKQYLYFLWKHYLTKCLQKRLFLHLY